MNAISAEAERLVNTPSLPILEEEQEVGEFKIVLDGADNQRKGISGEVIKTLKRAKSPIGLVALANRVASTKAAKACNVKDVKTRARACAKWWAKHRPQYVAKDEKERLYLVRA